MSSAFFKDIVPIVFLIIVCWWVSVGLALIIANEDRGTKREKKKEKEIGNNEAR